MNDVRRWASIKDQLRGNVPSIVLVLLAFTIYLIWALTLPIGQAPDEYMRFDVPLFILQNGMLPHGFEEAIRNEIWGTSYAFAPYGSSLFAVPFIWVASLFTSDVNALLFAARLVSVLCSTGTVVLCLLIGKRAFKNAPVVRYLFAVLVGFLPQFIFLSSYFNCDAFAVFTIALILYAWVRGLTDSWDKVACCVLGVGLGLCLLSYYNAYGFVLLSILVFLGSQISFKQLRKPTKEFVRSVTLKTLAVIGIALALSAWFFIRNAVLYDGDFLGMAASNGASELYAQEGYKPSERLSMADQGMSYAGLLTLNGFSWTISSLKSFVGLFGYMEILLPQPLYYAYYVVLLCAVAFAISAIIRMLKKGKSEVLLMLACVACIIIPVLLSVYYSLNIDYQAQGRYFISALLPFMFLASMGLYKALEKIELKRQRTRITVFFIGVYLVLAGVALATTIVPSCMGTVLMIA